MGENEGWLQPPSSRILPNGLLSSEVEKVTRELDAERWTKAEERTAELISCIQPDPRSEERRIAVADYVQRLIMNCFPCQVFTFGSVPLKTYLPDGDIDLTAFSNNQSLKDSWAHQVRDILESEEKNENAEFRVKEVQYIQAEVKIIKCLVENIVVDISFNQLGGLCTLCFLEEVDHLINQDHLFKRSIILIKAWCYYESRLLGAHHGLISTYALETLVLYIFHVFNSSFAGPLEVLYRFLEFFSKFDWDNFCISLWGPVPIHSLPNVIAESPRKDGGELLLSKLFLDACSSVYSAWPPPESQGQHFVSKHFNIIDPLRNNNNLGRSVSKGNFYRIRSAFAFGAKRLARLLECPQEDIGYEVNQFFSNTWGRHGSGNRPDAPNDDLNCLKLSNSDPLSSEELNNNSDLRKVETSSGSESQVDRMRDLHSIPSPRGKFSVESSSRHGDVSVAARAQSKKSSGIINNPRTPNLIRLESSSIQGVNANDVKGRFLFARTRSSPELTDSYSEVPSQGRQNRVPESGKGQTVLENLDSESSRNSESDVRAGTSIVSSTDGPASLRSSASRQSHESAAEMNSVSNSYHDDSGSGNMGEELASGIGIRGMHHEKQTIASMMAVSADHGVNGQFNMPLNLASGNLPFQISPSIIASTEYTQRNFGAVVPMDMHILGNPWTANMQYPHGLVPTPLNHYFPGVGSTSNSVDVIKPSNDNFGSVDINTGEADRGYFHEQEGEWGSEYDQEDGNHEMHQPKDKQQLTSDVYNLSLSRVSSCESATRTLPKSINEFRGLGEDDKDTFQHQEKTVSEVSLDDRKASSSSSSVGHSGGSLRSKTPSENSCDGLSKVWKSNRDREIRKTAQSAVTSNIYSKGNSVPEHPSIWGDEDIMDRNPPSFKGPDMTERSTEAPSVLSLQVPKHQMPGLESAQASGSDSVIPVAPMLLGPGSRERMTANSGSMPFTFYPTGPPVPFVAMLPLCNFQNEVGNAEMSRSHFTGEEGVNNNEFKQNFDASERLAQPEVTCTSSSMIRVASAEPEKHKSDILNGDFARHWQNLQYGRFCQNSPHPASVSYSSPVVPPFYLHGHFPWDGPGNIFTQLMAHGPRVVSIASLQSVSSRPAGVYQHPAEEMPRYRSGTGTYFPNPVAVRDRHSTSSRRGGYSYDRRNTHGDREGNWNGSKLRAASRSHNRKQGEKPGSRADRVSPSGSRGERLWASHRRELQRSFQLQNGPIRVPPQDAPANVTYGMHPIPAMDPNGLSSNGPNAPSFVMLYPYNHNSAYGSSTEQLEFGSLGPVGFSGLGDALPSSVASRATGTFEEQSNSGSSGKQSSLYKPTSSH